MGKPEPSILLVDGARAILPEGRVGHDAWPEFTLAITRDPAPPLLATWLGRLEARLGVTDEYRTAMERRAFAAVHGVEAKRIRAADEIARVAALEADARDPAYVGRIAALQERIAAARMAEQQPAGATDRDRRKAAKRARALVIDLTAKLEAVQAEEAEQARLLGDVADVILRQRSRGADVEFYEGKTAEFQRDEHGARVLERVRDKGRGRTYLRPVLEYGTGLRARNLTGPEHARANGDLDGGPRPVEMLMQTADEYRSAYLVIEAEETNRGDGGGGGGGPKAPQPRVIEAGQALADMRRGLSSVQRVVLDQVCGQDRRVSEATRAAGLGDNRTTARALRTGLAAARDSRRAAHEMRRAAGEAGDLQRRVSAGNRLLSRLRR